MPDLQIRLWIILCLHEIWGVCRMLMLKASGGPNCGDYLTISIKVENEEIKKISFFVFGCVAAIATSSMTTELTKAKTLKDALTISDEEIANALGGLPEEKMHCSVLGAAALKNAIENYRSKSILSNESK